MNPTPKTSSTRAQLPVGLSGTEPPNAPEGGLAYATDTEVVRVKTSTGWEDVGGGAGTITEIDAGTGIAITAGTGPVVTVATDLAAGTGIAITGTHPETIATDLAAGTGIVITGTHPQTIAANTSPSTGPFVLKDLNASYTHDASPSRDDRVYLQDSAGGTAKQSRVRELPVIEKDFSVYASLTPSVNSDIVFNIDGSPGAVRTCNLGDLAVAGQVQGTLGASVVKGITETSGPTALTVGAINDFQLLQRVGSTVVGTAYPPTTLVGDVNGLITANQVNKIHETSGPTTLTIGAIADGQGLYRSGTNLIGANIGLPTGNPYIDPPVTANAFDDEFETGSPDLAVRGWTIRNITTGVVLTRAGDIDPWGTVPANQYRSRLVGSQLMFQVGGAATTGFVISKALTITTTGMIWWRIGLASVGDARASDQAYFSAGLGQLSGVFFDFANRVYIETARTASASGFAYLYGSRRNTTNVLGIGSDVDLGPPMPTFDIGGIRFSAASTAYQMFVGDSRTGSTVGLTPPAGAINSNTVAAFGIAGQVNAADANSSQIYTIDFVRMVTGSNMWIANAPRPVLWNVVNADITTYTNKPAPVAADQIYIADSAASNAIKRTTVASTFSSYLDKVQVYLNTPANSHNTSTFAKVPIDTVLYDTNSLWDSVNKRIVPKKAGYYQFNARVRRNSTGSMVVSVNRSGTLSYAVGGDDGASAFAQGGPALVFCNGTTDYIETFMFSNASIAYTTGSFDTWMSVVGPF